MATISATAGRPFTTYLEGGPEDVTDWQIRIYDTNDVVVVGPAIDDLVTVTAGVISTPVNADEVLYEAELFAPAPAVGYEPDDDGDYAYSVAWMSDGVESEPDALLVRVGPVAGEFASLNDLAILLGFTSATEMTAAQVARGELLLGIASGLIIDAVAKTLDWAIALGPIPPVLRGVCLAAVTRVMNNPTGARSESETLGQHQHSVSYTDDAHGLLLTEREVALCRRAVYGRASATSMPETTLDQVIELCETGEIAGFPAE